MSPTGIPSYGIPYMGSTHMIAAGHHLATRAGYQMLEAGGNAVDAGVAAGIALNVTSPQHTSFAGVAPILVHRADTNERASISGLGRWPMAIEPDVFRKKYDGTIPMGVGRSVVPSACDAWLTALERYGTMSFEQVVGPSIEIADKGFPVTHRMTREFTGHKEYISQCPSTAEIAMPNGTPLQTGEMMVQKDLTRTFSRMTEVERAQAHLGRESAIRAARDFFYKGEIAETMVRFCQEGGGLLTLEDFARFSVDVETPEMGTYKDYTLYTCGSWCQGPSLIEVLNILEGFDLKAMGHGSAAYYHHLVEAIKLAFADRHGYFGDPDFVEVPLEGLLSKGYAADRREALDSEVAWPEIPPAGNAWPFEGHSRDHEPVASIPRPAPPLPDTSYVCVVDRWGNAFSATPSDGFNSTPVVPGLGMIISNRGFQTWLEPEHPSCLAPWKRPRLTPSPGIAFKNGRLFMPFGTPGGDIQVQAMAQMFLSIVEFGLSPQQAVEAPRVKSDSFPSSNWPHAYYPGQLTLEPGVDSEVAAKLAAMGHKIVWWDDFTQTNGDLCGIMVDHEGGFLAGGSDIRYDSYAMGW